MLLAIRLAFLVLVLLFVLAVATSCSRREEVRLFEPPPVAPVVRADPIVATEILAAETRRAQVIGEIARLTWVQRRTVNADARIALDVAIAERRAEVERLNAIVAP